MILQETLFINGAPLLNVGLRVFLEFPGEAALAWNLKIEQIAYVFSDVPPSNISDLASVTSLIWARTSSGKQEVHLNVSINPSIPLLK